MTSCLVSTHRAPQFNGISKTGLTISFKYFFMGRVVVFVVVGLGYQTQASTELPFIFGTGDVRDLDMQTNDFRVTLRASPISAQTTNLSAEANFHTSPEEEEFFFRYVFLLYMFVYLSCNTYNIICLIHYNN